jgi:hypothetical protein
MPHRVFRAVVLLLAVHGTVFAQGPGPGGPAKDRDMRRLFQRFVEDAAITPGGWIEGMYDYQNLEGATSHFAGTRIAFKVDDGLEAGLRFGFSYLDVRGGPDGGGISDVDLHLKYRLPGGGATRAAVGALLKAPSADEAEGLGTGEPDLALFAAVRADLEAVSLVANAGIRFNGQPDPAFVRTRDSLLAGVGILLPASDRVTFTIEGTWESRRIRGAGSDGRLTVGLQAFGEGGKGGFRGAVALPLTGGAPDAEILLGAVLTY